MAANSFVVLMSRDCMKTLYNILSVLQFGEKQSVCHLKDRLQVINGFASSIHRFYTTRTGNISYILHIVKLSLNKFEFFI